jgi:hypothetical protein
MVRLVLVLMVWAGMAEAELSSLFPGAGTQPDTATRASLFVPDRDSGMFAAIPDRTPTRVVAPIGTGTTPIGRLVTLIATAEAGPAGYEAVQYDAKVRPDRRPTQMTSGDIYEWIDATLGQPHAIGRYQFIPPTLRRVARVRGFGPETQFIPRRSGRVGLGVARRCGVEKVSGG